MSAQSFHHKSAISFNRPERAPPVPSASSLPICRYDWQLDAAYLPLMAYLFRHLFYSSNAATYHRRRHKIP